MWRKGHFQIWRHIKRFLTLFRTLLNFQKIWTTFFLYNETVVWGILNNKIETASLHVKWELIRSISGEKLSFPPKASADRIPNLKMLPVGFQHHLLSLPQENRHAGFQMFLPWDVCPFTIVPTRRFWANQCEWQGSAYFPHVASISKAVQAMFKLQFYL